MKKPKLYGGYMRKTKIICTLGPAVEDKIEELMLAGMNCARLNFSHGDYSEHKARMDKVKAAREKLGLPVAILLDTKGPEIRIGLFEKGSVEIKKGQEYTFINDMTKLGNEKSVPVNFAPLYKNVTAGTLILVDDGKVGFNVVEVVGEDIKCVALNDGKLSNRKSINVPNTNIEMEFMSEKDKNDVLFGIEQGVDFIAASFVRNEDDITQLRAFVNANGGQNIQIISKIENLQGIANLDKIVRLSDGIMVARGDMGVEVPFDQLPVIQKEIIKKCYRAGKHVVTATQMLESMTKNPRPTRAEVSDVANAIFDGTTAIMLSGETAAGDYPIEAVKAMAKIAETTENNINYKKRFETNLLDLGIAAASACANATVISANQLNAKAIVAVTNRGVTAQSISNYRPNSPIIAATPNIEVARQLNLAWNVKPIIINPIVNQDESFEEAIAKAVDLNLIKREDTIVIAGGVKKSNLQTGTVRIHKI